MKAVIRLTLDAATPDAIDQRARMMHRGAAALVALLNELAKPGLQTFIVEPSEALAEAVGAIKSDEPSLMLELDESSRYADSVTPAWRRLSEPARVTSDAPADAAPGAASSTPVARRMRALALTQPGSAAASSEPDPALVARISEAVRAGQNPDDVARLLGKTSLELHATLAPLRGALQDAIPLGASGQQWRAFLFGERPARELKQAPPDVRARSAARREAGAGFASIAETARAAARKDVPNPKFVAPVARTDDANDEEEAQ